MQFPGNSIPGSIGQRFSSLLLDQGLKALESRVVSSAKDAACKPFAITPSENSQPVASTPVPTPILLVLSSIRPNSRV